MVDGQTSGLFWCRLATVQSGRLPATPLVRTRRDVIDDDRCALLASIRQLVPDHAARCRALQVESILLMPNKIVFLEFVYLLYCSV